ncbi:helix-turn-helix domain-containing protein [Hydrogenophaga sp.]|uniref:helix-turn-helix domain-containing protein n=1 Tax=Hydrogenophaga sp. TaxID=1904254 RepID=UPI003563D6D8
MRASFEAGTGPKQWSTDVVRPEQRLDYWVGAICEAFLEMDCSSRSAAHFDGRLVSMPVGALCLNQVLASPQDVYRTPSAIARASDLPSFYLITQLSTFWRVRQGGQMVQLRPGDAVLVDAAQSYELHFPESVACLSIQMPRSWLGQWLERVDVPQPRVVHRDQGWGQTLSALCLQLGKDPALAAAMPAAALSEQLGVLLSATLSPVPVEQQSRARQLYTDALALIRSLQGDHSLRVDDVAQRLGVSVRSLHRSFALAGQTVAASLRQHRLLQAQAMLAQRRFAGLPVSEVGRRCGYQDASHFVRDFQREVGTTPARWRRLQAAMH